MTKCCDYINNNQSTSVFSWAGEDSIEMGEFWHSKLDKT